MSKERFKYENGKTVYPHPLPDSDIDFGKLQARKIDMNDPNVKKIISECHKHQDLLRKLQKIDWAKLSNTYITI